MIGVAHLVVAIVVLLLLCTHALQVFYQGYPVHGLILAIMPLLWLGAFPLLMFRISRSQLGPPWKAGAQILIVTTSIAGSVLGYVVAAFAAIGRSYGTPEQEIAFAHVLGFLLGGTAAFAAGTVLAATATAIIYAVDKLRRSRANGSM